jgi:hypothetical protein
MRVGPSMWDLPSYEGLLYSCCIGVVNLTFSIFKRKNKKEKEKESHVDFKVGHISTCDLCRM